MKRKFNLLKNKSLIVAVIGILIFSSVGFVSAYFKLSQNPQAPAPSQTALEELGYGADGEEDFEIRKSLAYPLPQGSRVDSNGVLRTSKGSEINYQIKFKGKIDKNPNKVSADVMILVDRSMTMKNKAKVSSEEGDCIFNGFDPNSSPGDPQPKNYVKWEDRYLYNNSKLCWAEKGAMGFIDLTSDDKADLRVGYVTYGGDAVTKKVINDPNWKVNAQYFKSLSDMKNEANRVETRQWLNVIGFHSGYSGTAMAKAADIALEELKNNGRDEVDGKKVKKYIILLTDGIGNQLSDYSRNNPNNFSGMTGCMSFRSSPNDAWPTTWPSSYQPCQLPASYGTQENCCIEASLGVEEAFQPHRLIGVVPLEFSPVGLAINQKIKIPTIGFGKPDTPNMNPKLLENISVKTYEGSAEEPIYGVNETPEGIIDLFNKIFEGIVDDRGATITFKETLPLGVDIDLPGGFQIFRDVNDPEICGSENPICSQLFSVTVEKKIDGNGRVVLIFVLDHSHYSRNISFSRQNFYVKLKVKTANASNSVFDLDQNWDGSCNGDSNAPVTNVSLIKWDFPLSKYTREPTRMPKLCVELRASQYTGDVYGAGINNYLFPYIDVLVSGGTDGRIAPGSQAVWELPQYNFSATSFSNFSNYQDYLSSQIESLKNKAENKGNISEALQTMVPEKVHPEGKIFYVKGNQTLDNPAPMNGRRTVIIDGDLTINASISKVGRNKERSTAVIIVLGNVTINNAASIQAGIIAPGLNSQGLIGIESSRNYLDILGFIIGKRVSLKNLATADTQSINYDPDLLKYPPPGLSKLSLPFYQEVAP